jgi:hypothetical protein
MHLRGLTVPVDNLLVFNSGDFGNYGNFCRARTANLTPGLQPATKSSW